MFRELSLNQQKWAIAIFAGVIFYLISTPWTYEMTNVIFSKVGMPTVGLDNKPTYFGQFLHVVVYAIVAKLAMAAPMP